jgi:hypothetical protein
LWGGGEFGKKFLVAKSEVKKRKFVAGLKKKKRGRTEEKMGQVEAGDKNTTLFGNSHWRRWHVCL